MLLLKVGVLSDLSAAELAAVEEGTSPPNAGGFNELPEPNAELPKFKPDCPTPKLMAGLTDLSAF